MNNCFIYTCEEQNLIYWYWQAILRNFVCIAASDSNSLGLNSPFGMISVWFSAHNITGVNMKYKGCDLKCAFLNVYLGKSIVLCRPTWARLTWFIFPHSVNCVHCIFDENSVFSLLLASNTVSSGVVVIYYDHSHCQQCSWIKQTELSRHK